MLDKLTKRLYNINIKLVNDFSQHHDKKTQSALYNPSPRCGQAYLIIAVCNPVSKMENLTINQRSGDKGAS